MYNTDTSVMYKPYQVGTVFYSIMQFSVIMKLTML